MKIVPTECPVCGGEVEPRARECPHCQSTLLVTSLDKTFGRGGHEEGRLVSAASKLTTRIEEEPLDVAAHYALGLVCLNRHQKEEALKHLRKAAKLAPRAPEVHYSLAVTLFDDGNVKPDTPEFKEVSKAADLACTLDPGFTEAAAFQHWVNARTLQSMDQRRTIEEYKKAIELCSDVAIFHNNMGLCYCNLGKQKEAEEALSTATTLDPRSALPHINLALVYFKQQRFKEGLAAGDRAFTLMPLAASPTSRAYAHNNYSLNLFELGQIDDALHHVNEALELVPSEPTFSYNHKRYTTEKAARSPKVKAIWALLVLSLVTATAVLVLIYRSLNPH